MGLIDAQEQARRLARALASDIHLYHSDAIANGSDLSDAIDEGRTLFKARVVQSLWPQYEAGLAELGIAHLDRRGAEASATPAASVPATSVSSPTTTELAPPSAPTPRPMSDTFSDTPPERKTSPVLFVLTLVLLTIGFGLATWLALQSTP